MPHVVSQDVVRDGRFVHRRVFVGLEVLQSFG